MLLSYIKIALRNLRRNQLISFINIFGLGLAMSVGLMELVIVQDALSYDRFHPYPNRTWRVISDYRQNDGQHWKLASTPCHSATPWPKIPPTSKRPSASTPASRARP
ncbi:hypothetical protein ACQ86N_31030 [Puia sp. P3]|uniref:hypothetical protein n=1 Tax=Puia sp. P3 TaxID=3423952 RepID=UPI003D668DAE